MAKKKAPADLKELQDKFELFLFEMDDALMYFRQTIAGFEKPELIPLDYSFDSLKRAEMAYDLILDGTIQIPDIDNFTTRVGRYLGETLRRNIGGTWKMCADPRDISYGLPCITGFYGLGDFDWSPLSVVFNYRVRRKSGLFLDSIKPIVDAVEMHKKRV